MLSPFRRPVVPLQTTDKQVDSTPAFALPCPRSVLEFPVLPIPNASLLRGDPGHRVYMGKEWFLFREISDLPEKPRNLKVQTIMEMVIWEGFKLQASISELRRSAVVCANVGAAQTENKHPRCLGRVRIFKHNSLQISKPMLFWINGNR